MRQWQGFSVLLLFLVGLSFAIPETMFNPESRHFLFLIGVVGAWRYSVGFIHFVRSQLFLRWVYPKLKKKAEDNKQALLPSACYLMVTSFRINVETSIEVYHSIFQEAVQCIRGHDIETTIVASIVEYSDELLIKEVYKNYNCPELKLLIVRIPGTGKRDGLASGFRAISRTSPPGDAVVAVIDGDTVLEEGVTLTCLPYFKLLPSVGALTTNEYCQLPEDFDGDSRLMEAWHSLRFGQRHMYMNSMGLSKRVLTLTGRMSVFRADIVCDPVFIKDVEEDFLTHWRLGTVQIFDRR